LHGGHGARRVGSTKGDALPAAAEAAHPVHSGDEHLSGDMRDAQAHHPAHAHAATAAAKRAARAAAPRDGNQIP
jgi:hypothetical protein